MAADRRFDAALDVLAALDHAVSRRGAYTPTSARVSGPSSCASWERGADAGGHPRVFPSKARATSTGAVMLRACLLGLVFGERS